MDNKYKKVPEVASLFKTNQSRIKNICNEFHGEIPSFPRRNDLGHRELSKQNIFAIAAVIGLSNFMTLEQAVEEVKQQFYRLER